MTRLRFSSFTLPVLALALLALPALLALTATRANASSPFTDRLLRDETLWGDGKAEYAVFDATERRYGEARETEVRHILVRENFAANERVKADDWREPGAYPVIKLNQIITVPTGSYRYDQGHSSFWRADSGELLKYAHTTSDSCGLTYKQGDRDGPRWRQRVFAYWQGMSETDTRAEPPPGALFYDELPFKLRLLDWPAIAKTGGATRFTAPLMASVIGSKADPLAWQPAAFSVERVDANWRVTVTHARGEDRFVFAAASPHGLLRWERWDGTALTLRHTIRMPYWELHNPGDERYLRPGATFP
ncbi:MAG: hypothetical protein H7067_15090 [Burkholderiales bacterium]|nr:hypothetical protein [Opitutaceae bacterium]